MTEAVPIARSATLERDARAEACGPQTPNVPGACGACEGCLAGVAGRLAPGRRGLVGGSVVVPGSGVPPGGWRSARWWGRAGYRATFVRIFRTNVAQSFSLPKCVKTSQLA